MAALETSFSLVEPSGAEKLASAPIVKGEAKVDFASQGFVMRYRRGSLSTNLPSIHTYFDSEAWERREPWIMFKLSESILKQYFAILSSEKVLNQYIKGAVRSAFCNDVISTMPKSGGRIPSEEIGAWLIRFNSSISS